MKIRSATLALSALVVVLALAWTAVAECPPCEWVEETGWAASEERCRYLERGNWAMYTCVEKGQVRPVDLVAGQHLIAGEVILDASASECEENEVKITITLNPGWRFANVPENVKIQDYCTAPKGTPPIPGQFEHKFDATTSPFSVCVPMKGWYGIHVDLERCVSNNFN